MTNYSTNLTPWGASGSEYPNGYAYIEGEQPVDAWDNFFNANVYSDLEHLINLTNSRLDTTRSTTAPTAPTAGEQWYDTDNGQLGFYDDTESGWETVATQDWVLNEASLGNADTLDGYDSSEFAVRAENEHITGDWEFDGRADFNKAIDIYAKYSHIDMFESDNNNKNWRFEVNAGEFRVTEVGVNEQFAIEPGGLVDMPGGATFGSQSTFNSNVIVTGGGELNIRNSGKANLRLENTSSGDEWNLRTDTGDLILSHIGHQRNVYFKSDGNFENPKGDIMTQNGWVATSDSPRSIYTGSSFPSDAENGDLLFEPV